MSRYFALIALAILVALPLTAQTTQTCNLQITVNCKTSTNGSATCTSTTINSGTNLCVGQFFSGYYALGTGQLSGVTNSLGLTECFDSSLFPQPGESYAFCFGPASLGPGAQFTTAASVSAGSSQIFGVTGVYDDTFSKQEAFVVAEANVKTPTCTPAISAPPVTQSGLDYQVVWTSVSDPAAQFSLEESTTPDFSTLTSKTLVNGNSKTFNHDVGATTSIFYYRVQATNCNGSAGPYSNPTLVIVQAQAPATSKNPDVTVPLGTTQPVSIKVFIPGSASGATSGDRNALSDPTFTATTDKPYLTVTPPAGTIPPQGTTVTVTASPGSLPAGANTGTLKVTSNGTTSNTPVSINLVTPVAPTTLTTPPPNALIIPVVTHVNAAAGPFLSDVRLTNAGSQPVTYQVTMSSTVNGVVNSKATVVTVGSQETTALNDIVKNFYGLGATGASADVGFGALEIHPVDSASLLTYAASRTYVSQSGGTLGQFIAAVPFSRFASKIQSPIAIPGAGASSITKLSLQQVSQSARFRTNVGLAEGAGQPASGLIHIFDAAGNNLKDVPFSLLPGEQKQMNGFISANGIPTLTDGRIEVEITSPTGAVTAYASVLDNQTTDPLAVTPVDVSSVSSTRYVIPGIAELNNGPSTNFHSDVRLFNGGAGDVVANLTFYPQAGLPGAGASKSLLVHGGEVAVLDNILPTLFNVSGSGGSVVVTTPAASSLVATARTYTVNASNGTYGQFIPGVRPEEGIGKGDRPLQVLQLEQSDRFRSNLGLVELTGNPVTVEVSLYTPDSKTTPSFPVTLAANEFRQLGGVIAQFLGAGTQTYNARVSVKVIDGSGRVSAYGSVIDNQSADPTYVPSQ